MKLKNLRIFYLILCHISGCNGLSGKKNTGTSFSSLIVPERSVSFLKMPERLCLRDILKTSYNNIMSEIKIH